MFLKLKFNNKDILKNMVDSNKKTELFKTRLTPVN